MVRALLSRYGLRPRKGLGQNFLVDPNIGRKILEIAGISPADVVVEVGPGTGALTVRLAARAGIVIAIELDRRMEQLLAEVLDRLANVRLVFGDALTTDFDRLVTESLIESGTEVAPSGPGCMTCSNAVLPVSNDNIPAYKVVANLPYYITNRMLFHLLEDCQGWESLVLMVQREVAERMVASPGSASYGLLSIAVYLKSRAKIELRLPPSVFWPVPDVDSAVVRLIRHQRPPVDLREPDFYWSVVRASFGQRRKTLLNALTNAGIGGGKTLLSRALSEAGIDPGRRGEELSPEEFAVVTSRLGNQ